MNRMQPLVSALCAGLVFCSVASTGNATEEPKKKTSAYMERLSRLSDPSSDEREKTKKEAEEAALYPQATRVPKITTGEPSLIKQRNQMITQLDAKKYDAAYEIALKLDANPKANDHDHAESLFVQKNVVTLKDTNNHKEAIPLLEKILELDSLSNNVHYGLMSELAQRYLLNLDYQDAFETSEKFLSETKTEKKEILLVKGNALYRLKRFPEAIAILEKVRNLDPTNTDVSQMLVKAYSENKQPEKAAALAKTIVQASGNDQVSRTNMAITFFEAKQYAEAGDIIDDLRATQKLATEHDYKTAVMVYQGMKNHEADLASVIQDGLNKGVLPANAQYYNLLAESYYYSDRTDDAITSWSKAAPLSKDGSVYLNLAIVQCQEERWAACKESAKNAIAKGGINTSDAKNQILIADKKLGSNK
ncbi:MAG: tetratricopeptide repeat protein [Arenimonas sp.]